MVNTRSEIQVLLVQGDLDSAEVIGESLEKRDDRFNVQVTSNVQEAMKLYIDEDVDCIISESNIGGRSGIDFLETVRREHPNFPFVIFSGNGSEEVASEAIGLGVTDYIKKGTGDEKHPLLAERVTSAVKNHRESKEKSRKMDLLQKVQEIENVGAWEMNMKAKEMRCTKQACQILDVPNGTISDYSEVIDLFHQNDKITVQKKIDRAVDQEESFDAKVRLKSRNSVSRWVRIRGEPKVVDGEITFIHGTIQGIFNQKKRKQEDSELTKQIGVKKGQYESLFNSIPDPILVADTNREIVNCNRSFENLFGYDLDELQGKLTKYVYEDEEEYEELGRVIEGHLDDREFSYTVSYEKKSGQTFPGETNIFYLQDDNEISGYIGVIKDISDLDELTTRLNIVLEGTDSVVWGWDSETDKINWSDSGRDLFEVDLDTWCRSLEDFTEYIHPADRPEVKEAFNTAVETGDSLDVEFRLQSDESTQRWVQARGRVRESSNGLPKLTGLLTNITEVKDREAELTEANQRLNAVIESAPDAIIVINPEGEVKTWNPAAEQMFGWSAAEVLDEQNPIIPETRREEFKEFVDKVLSGESIRRVETVRETKTGDRIDVSLSTAAIHSAEGNVIGIMGILQDISERKRREQELKTVLEHMDDAVLVHEEGGQFIMVNQVAIERYGYEKAEFYDMAPTDLDVPEESKRVPQRTARINQEGKFRFETKHQRASGDPIPVEIVSTSIVFRGEPAVLSIARDISRRKKRIDRLEKRERILRSLHSTTENFLAAETKEEVFERIIEGLTLALDYQYVGVREFDSEKGTLVPAALSTTLKEDSEVLSEIDPGEHPIWQVFIDEETRTIQDLSPDELPSSLAKSSTAILAVPIGNEGVILLGDRSKHSFENIEIEMVELLAHNAEAMLERLNREAEIQELDYEITTIESQMQKMKSWMSAIEAIQNQLSEIDTIEKIEQVVCEELSGIEGVNFVWIGRPEMADTDISPVEWAGSDRGYLDSLELKAENDALPSQRVAEHREMISISNIPDHVSNGDWAKVALSSNFRSVVSVPIVNDEILYAVLTAYSKEKSAFEQLSQNLMADLGSILANAYRMVNIQSGTTRSEVEELEFGIMDDTYPLLALAKSTNATVSFDSVLETSESTVRILLTVVKGDSEKVLEQAQTMLQVENCGWFGNPNDNQLALTLSKPFIAEAVEGHGGRLVESVADPKKASLQIQHSSNVPVRQLINWLNTQFQEIELLARRTRLKSENLEIINAEHFLTQRQYDILKAAYSGGYYETPKGITGKQLAESFDISRPAIYNHLQAAQRRVLKRVFD